MNPENKHLYIGISLLLCTIGLDWDNKLPFADRDIIPLDSVFLEKFSSTKAVYVRHFSLRVLI